MKWHLEGHQEPVQAPAPKQEFGRANPCPACGSAGFLEHIDIIDRIQYEHCPECGHKWSQTEAELQQV
jgi:Zn ribbon nucleic-acid-binding protein